MIQTQLLLTTNRKEIGLYDVSYRRALFPTTISDLRGSSTYCKPLISVVATTDCQRSPSK